MARIIGVWLLVLYFSSILFVIAQNIVGRELPLWYILILPAAILFLHYSDIALDKLSAFAASRRGDNGRR